MFDRCSIIDTAYLTLSGSFPSHLPAFLVAIATINIHDYSNMPRGLKHIFKFKKSFGRRAGQGIYPSLGR